jgi:hypothetical protein
MLRVSTGCSTTSRSRAEAAISANMATTPSPTLVSTSMLRWRRTRWACAWLKPISMDYPAIKRR